jgi:hypothetical protein
MMRVDRNFAAPGMRAAVMGCFLLLGMALPAASGPAPSAPPPWAQPAAPDDPAKVAAARDFIILYHPNADPKNVSAMIDRYLPRAIEAQREQDPKLDAKKFAQEKRAKIMANATKSLDMQSHVVSRHFTLPELKGLIAFYSSPLGRKLTVETPKITMDMRMMQREQMMKGKVTGGPKSGKVVLTPADPKKK